MNPAPENSPGSTGPNVRANRRARKWTASELVRRALWAFVQPVLFSLSPRPLWGWRRMLLRCFGAKIGRDVHVFPSVRIAIPWHISIGDDSAVGDGVVLYSLGQIAIGRRATVSQYAHLCAGTHDYRDPAFRLLKKPISIGDGAWICADAFVGPGVVIGTEAILGARGVAVKDVAPGVIAAGNPAKPVKQRRAPPPDPSH